MGRAYHVNMRTLDVKQPFSFAQSLAFIGNFTATRDACVLADDSLTSAVSLDGKAHAFTLREHRGELAIEVHGRPKASVVDAVERHARDLLSTDDDLAPLYAAGESDRPFADLVRELHGLHQVRFGTLADAVVYSICMQRAPMPVAAALKRKFLAALGHPVEHGGATLRAMPSLGELAQLDDSAIVAAIGHRPKAERIASVAREVHAIGEAFLRTAPYEQARDALLDVKGIGPFAAAAILLRGLGRMDELPWMAQFEQAAKELYGRAVSEQTLVKRYGRHIGYWSFYVMTGLGRRERAVH